MRGCGVGGVRGFVYAVGTSVLRALAGWVLLFMEK